MLDGTLFFVKSARCGSRARSLSGFFYAFISSSRSYHISPEFISKNGFRDTSGADFLAIEIFTYLIDKKRYFHHI